MNPAVLVPFTIVICALGLVAGFSRRNRYYKTPPDFVTALTTQSAAGEVKHWSELAPDFKNIQFLHIAPIGDPADMHDEHFYPEESAGRLTVGYGSDQFAGRLIYSIMDFASNPKEIEKRWGIEQTIRDWIIAFGSVRGMIFNRDFTFAKSCGALHVIFKDRQGLEIGLPNTMPSRDSIMNWLDRNWDKNFAWTVSDPLDESPSTK